jgi:hypothetical protein
MAKNIIDTPMTGVESYPSNFKGGPGGYDGEKGAFGGYPRSSNSGAPEKIYDGSVPTTGKGEISPAELPKNIG